MWIKDLREPKADCSIALGETDRQRTCWGVRVAVEPVSGMMSNEVFYGRKGGTTWLLLLISELP